MINISDLYKQFLNESAMVSKIEQGIKRGDIVVIDYDPEDKDPNEQSKGSGRRVIIPFVYGLSKSDNQVVRAWQLSGKSRTPNGDGKDPLKKIAGWRLFRIDRIKTWNRSSRTLNDSFDDILSDYEISQIKDYNPNDSQMKTVYISSVFPDKINKNKKI